MGLGHSYEIIKRRRTNMTLPDERFRAVMMTKEFLLKLLDPKATPRVPLDIRRQARSVLRHFPHQYEMERVAKKSPDVFKADRDEK